MRDTERERERGHCLPPRIVGVKKREVAPGVADSAPSKGPPWASGKGFGHMRTGTRAEGGGPGCSWPTHGLHRTPTLNPELDRMAPVRAPWAVA